MMEDGLFRIEGNVAPDQRIDVSETGQAGARLGDAQAPARRTRRLKGLRAPSRSLRGERRRRGDLKA